MTKTKTQIHSKVGGGTAAGALSIIGIWLLSSSGVEVPIEVASAFTTLFAFLGGYFASS